MTLVPTKAGYTADIDTAEGLDFTDENPQIVSTNLGRVDNAVISVNATDTTFSVDTSAGEPEEFEVEADDGDGLDDVDVQYQAYRL